MATFVSLLDPPAAVRRRRPAGSSTTSHLAGEVVWATRPRPHVDRADRATSGDVGRDAEAAYGECLRRLALGFGDDPDALARSLAVARRRARRVDSRRSAVGQRGPSAQAVSTR